MVFHLAIDFVSVSIFEKNFQVLWKRMFPFLSDGLRHWEEKSKNTQSLIKVFGSEFVAQPCEASTKKKILIVIDWPFLPVKKFWLPIFYSNKEIRQITVLWQSSISASILIIYLSEGEIIWRGGGNMSTYISTISLIAYDRSLNFQENIYIILLVSFKNFSKFNPIGVK